MAVGLSKASAAAEAVFSIKKEVFLNGERDPGNRTEETNLGGLITEAMIWSVESSGGLDQYPDIPVVGIINGGCIRASVDKGQISRRDINTVLPFGDNVSVVLVNGKELLEALEASTFCTPDAVGGFPQTCGMEWTLDTTVPYDQGDVYELDGKESSYYAPASIRRVSIRTVNGQPFDIGANYVVVTREFCATGGDTYNVFNRAFSQGFGYDTGIPMDAAVVDYIVNALDGVIGEKYAEPPAEVTIILPQ